jgi:hypothetical protein
MRSYLLNKFTVTERQIASRIPTNIDLTSKYAMENSLVLEQVDETSTFRHSLNLCTKFDLFLTIGNCHLSSLFDGHRRKSSITVFSPILCFIV